MAVFFHTVHAVLAGIWLGSLMFTTLVVSPALNRMEWGDRERVLVRARIGRQFLWLANPVLLLLALFLVLDGVASPLPTGRLVRLLVELGLVALVAGLAGSHGFFFGTRLRDLAAQEAQAPSGQGPRFAAARRRLQRVSFGVSVLDLVASLAVAVLAVNL
ncbi:MAG: hypothetical protein LBJ87_04240 [bacterium]|jgi:putative copper export protein|nr:hypothetical protein [bacterium]